MTITRSKSRGFSLIELLVVIAIMLAVAAIAMPYFVTYLSTYRLRGSLGDAAGFLQKMRVEAARRNTTLQVSTGTRDNGRSIAWVNLPGGTTAWDSGEPFIELPKNIAVVPSGYPGDATTIPNYHAQNSSTVIQFNSRGLPCVPNPSGSTNCENNDGTYQVGFVLYFKNTGSFGVPNWGAITIAPTGRIRTWVWNGGSYSGQ